MDIRFFLSPSCVASPTVLRAKRFAAFWTLPTLAALMLLCVASMSGQNAGQPSAALPASSPAVLRHNVPWRSGLEVASFASAPAGAHLTYSGGPVVSNVQGQIVYWGSGVRVSQTTKPGLSDFYQGTPNSAFFDMFSEYATDILSPDGSPGTQQSIGRGSFALETTITPSITATSINDSDVKDELIAQLTKGSLPAPRNLLKKANGHAVSEKPWHKNAPGASCRRWVSLRHLRIWLAQDTQRVFQQAPRYNSDGSTGTTYMIYFPPKFIIAQGTSSSCVAGGFCAYHNTVMYSGVALTYSVIPDFSPGSGCDTGCGAGTEF